MSKEIENATENENWLLCLIDYQHTLIEQLQIKLLQLINTINKQSEMINKHEQTLFSS